MTTADRPVVPEPALYIGEVMHQRLRPFRHRFVYRVFSLLLDVDRVDAGEHGLRLLSLRGFNLFGFPAKDHGPRDGSALRPWVEARLNEACIDCGGGPIRILAFPRFLGYVFNPISVYYCYDPAGHLRAVVHEVKNTFGGQHPYALPVESAGGDHPIRQRCGKNFYVSPFIELAAGYRFRLKEPGERLAVVIQEEVADGTQLVATLTGRRRPLSDRELVRAALRIPFMPHKVIAGIHWEALKLWLKGARYHPRHQAEMPAEVRGENA